MKFPAIESNVALRAIQFSVNMISTTRLKNEEQAFYNFFYLFLNIL